MRNLFLFIVITPLFFSCANAVNKIFGSTKTPHEVYAAKVESVPAGKQWLAVANNSLVAPLPVRMPYRHRGYFPAEKARALSLQFTVQRGEHLAIDLGPELTIQLFADLFRADGSSVTPLHSFPTDARSFGIDAEVTTTFILRLQPALNDSGHYDLSILNAASLGFPVAGSKARVGSVWGDSRDEGSRSHKGIDIFAPKLTPAIAAADGVISSVRDGGLGGKTINLRVRDRNLSLYYAHLDQQLVEDGDQVQKGDTIGLIGNTGNARTTPPHLHFGIYTYDGAIDPLPFVNRSVTVLPVVANKNLLSRLQLTKPLLLEDKTTFSVATLLVPLAVTASSYIAELPDGKIIEVGFAKVKKV